MTFKQFTTCIEAQYHNKTSQYVQATVAAAAAVAPLAVIPTLIAPWCNLFLIPIAAAVWLMVYCQWFLHDRLICLPNPTGAACCPGGTDPVVIGVVVDILDPKDNTFPDSIDTDYSFSMFLAPNLPTHLQFDTDQHKQEAQVERQNVEASVPYGFLMAAQTVTQDISVPFTSHLGTNKDTQETSWVLHCEFEGAGVRDLLLAARIALAPAVAALAVCLLVPGWVGFLIAAILALLSLLVDGLGAYIGQGDHGSPADVNPVLGDELHIGHILVVMGSWVYDSGHNVTGGGWNEIHPIKFCTPHGKWIGHWPQNIADIEARWTKQVCEATSPVILAKQQLPQNQWQVHPIIDGCQPLVIP